MPKFVCYAFLGLALILPSRALAHAQGEDYVVVKFLESSIEGHFEIHLDDLQAKLDIDVDSSEDEALADVVASASRVQAYIEEHFTIAPEGGDPYALAFTHQDVIELPQGQFAQYHFRVPTGELPDRLDLHHSMFYEGDRLHRGLVLVEYNAKTDTTYPSEYTAMVFSPRCNRSPS